MRATNKQINFIELLANDLSMDRRTRNTTLSTIVNRDIHYIDELTMSEASKAIEYLKDLKEGV